MNRAGLLAMIAAVLCVGPARAQMSRQEAESIFMQANVAFRNANASTDDEEARRRYYNEAILCYEKLIRQGGIANSKLFYNLASAYLLNGDVGRAVLHFRNAEELDPADADIQTNLAYARSRRLDKIDTAPRQKVMERLFFWHYHYSMRWRFAAACTAFAVMCLAATLRIWLPSQRWAVVAAAIAAVIALALGVSVAVERHTDRTRRFGVIVAESVEARQGDGPAYPPSFKEPLHAGTEFDLLEQRPGWWHIRLMDGKTTWIPEQAAELVIF
ncbi:MAG TPA: hypothetical protein P5279_14315 [Anaerohalosphaeraceae bacterium]|jgi:hypothetical protein|nr:hypothetical protein [Anaerohalosphaeraceae bacterium]HRT51662.1 hypothetical protein [Anaerohalosphaeraceae bacterium]HRT87673.1 hypothetical protein [Anaerohalosphaeraceae bacterium]